MAESSVRITQMFNHFQKAAATKAILEQQLAREQAELTKLEFEVNEGLTSLGYVPTPGGPTPEQFLEASMAAIEMELDNFERSVQ